MKKSMFVCVLVTLLLAACGRPTTGSGPAESPLPTAPVSPITTISPLPVPPLESETREQKLEALQVQVAEQLGLSAMALTLVSVEQVTWPDMSLGCPQPDMTYAQVLTPGWRVVFVDESGQEYNVHTAENREHFVICEPSAESTVPPSYQDNPAVEAAIKALAEQEGIAVASISVVDVAAVEWPNSCLGCEKRGQYCLMVITPGYRIVLQSGTETYAVHTDRSGRRAIICTEPGVTPPRSDS